MNFQRFRRGEWVKSEVHDCIVDTAGSTKRLSVRPSVCLYVSFPVPSIGQQQQQRAEGLLLSVQRAGDILIDSRRWRPAANAGSVLLTAKRRG